MTQQITLPRKLKLTFERDVIATQSFELDVEVIDTSNEPLKQPSIWAKDYRTSDPIEFDDRCFATLEEAAIEWFELRADVLTSEVGYMGEPAGNEIRVYGLPEEVKD
jgi:hypothetical protein